MKSLTSETMMEINGGKYDCWKMVGGFASALGASFFGPAGIPVGLAAFGYGVSRAADCEEQGWF